MESVDGLRDRVRVVAVVVWCAGRGRSAAGSETRTTAAGDSRRTAAAGAGLMIRCRRWSRRLDLESYKATIKGLTQFGDRRQGTDRNRAAVDWIEAQLKSYGCPTERIKYDYVTPQRGPRAGQRGGAAWHAAGRQQAARPGRQHDLRHLRRAPA